MIRKVLIGAGLLAGLGVFAFGSSFFSYARTAVKDVREAIRSEVPLEMEVKRARDMITNLVPEMHECMRVVARQQVDIDHLERKIDRKTAELETQRSVILALRERAGKGEYLVSTQGRHTPADIERDLKVRFDRFQRAEKGLAQDRQLLEAQKTALQANQSKLNEMLGAKEELEVQIAELDARLQTLRAAQSASTVAIDDSELARTRGLIEEIGKRIDVDQRVLDADTTFNGLIPVDTPEEASQGVLEQIDSYFGPSDDAKSAAVSEAKPAA